MLDRYISGTAEFNVYVFAGISIIEPSGYESCAAPQAYSPDDKGNRFLRNVIPYSSQPLPREPHILYGNLLARKATTSFSRALLHRAL